MGEEEVRTKVSGREFGKLVCEAIGFPVSLVAEMHIHITPNDAVSVDIKRFLSKREGEMVASLLEKYELVEKQDFSE